MVQQEWGQGLIRSWNAAGWFDLPQRLGARIASLIGAGADEVVAADSTSVNLFKVLAAAIRIAQHADPARRVIVSERSNFPTDLYIAEALCQSHGCSLQLVEADGVLPALGPQVAVLYHQSWPAAGVLPLLSLNATLSKMADHGVMSRTPSSLVSRS